MAIRVLKYIGFAENAGKSRTEVYDNEFGKCTPQTGNKPVRSPYKLGFPKDGSILTGTAALTELRNPVWGVNHNQPFGDTLPTLTPAVPQYIYSMDAQYDWHPYDKTKPSTYPPTQVADNGRGWECEDSRVPMKYYQNMYWDVADAAVWADILHIFRYRKQKSSDIESIKILNPQFAIVEAQRAAERSLYEQMLQETFVLMATYQFPAYPCVGSWKWYEGLTIAAMTEVSPKEHNCNHPLATADGGWKMLLKPMPVDFGNSQWDGFVQRTILIAPPKYTNDYKVKRLLGL